MTMVGLRDGPNQSGVKVHRKGFSGIDIYDHGRYMSIGYMRTCFGIRLRQRTELLKAIAVSLCSHLY